MFLSPLGFLLLYSMTNSEGVEGIRANKWFMFLSTSILQFSAPFLFISFALLLKRRDSGFLINTSTLWRQSISLADKKKNEEKKIHIYIYIHTI